VLRGEVELVLRLDPRPDYGRRPCTPVRRGRLGWSYLWDDEIIFVVSELDWQPQDQALTATIRLAAGDRRHVSLAYCKADAAVIPPLGAPAQARIEATRAWWQDWSGRCRYDGPYRDAVVRSALTLKLLTYPLSGAIVAAATTSLPEAIGRDRNFDYRYCWLRDAGLTNQALVDLGYRDEAEGYVNWLLHATRLTWPRLNVMYDVFGRTDLVEQELPHLTGYRGSRPVRIGNGAATQQQLDVYGELVMAADAVANGNIGAAEARLLRGCGEFVCRHWSEPDSSLWEIRGPPRHYTFSKVMCWVALDRLLKIAARKRLDLGASAPLFETNRAMLAHAIETRGYNARLESYTSELDGSQVDASLLLMPCVGYRAADDPRVIATWRRIVAVLDDKGLLRRYEPDYDGVTSREGAFGICGFWAIDHLAKRGEIRAAERKFEHLLGYANDVGLYAEEIDAASGAALGNFPQAFSHVGLINAALAIEKNRSSAS
jgi:GH15 family glucan-1,4-alpha-glucosidase